MNTSPRDRAKKWDEFFYIYFFSLGALFLVFGIIFFFAFNWNELHRFHKFAIILSGLIFTHILWFFQSLERLQKKIIEIVLFFLYGTSILIFGQVYQTGADAYDLFLTWVIVCLIPTFVFRNFYVFILWLTIFAICIELFFEQVYPITSGSFHSSVVAILFGMITISVRKFYRFLFSAENERWLEPYIYFVSLIFLLLSTTSYHNYADSLDLMIILTGWIFPILYLIFTYLYFRSFDFSVPHISLCLLFGLFFIEVRLSDYFQFDDLSTYAIHFLAIIGYTILSVTHIQKLSKRESYEN